MIFNLKTIVMQQPNLPILSTDNKKNELTNFIHAHDTRHPAITPIPYLAGERDNKQVTETKNNEPVIMLDLFGALNY